MKKLLSILLLLVYTMSALGMSVRYHYCNDKLTNISVDLGVHHDCSCSVPNYAKGCCKDKVFSLKGDSHKAQQFLQSNPMQGLEIEPLQVQAQDVILTQIDEKTFGMPGTFVQSRSPHPIYILNRTFRI